MSNVRDIWHFKPQNVLHQEILLLSIANFFTIVLQCNFIFKIALQHNSKKKKLIFYYDGNWEKERINDDDWGKYYFTVQIYYFNEQNREIKVWDTGSIIKWDSIIDKVTFWNDKIEQSIIF